ncbi:uncharacterized protein LOC102798394 [Neolamprologus brichardi]|uniref:uncharacterized protein LOC102798394 n=1 Tax=Neolamprologus brichardi TaxID=32507 RepID=UPI001643B6F1|nr:uncharacterized protein LOC102798394 [Neolamprologus brichardi]
MSPINIQPPRPELTVNPMMITETDSVTVNCQTPSSVSVTQCFLYFMRGRKSTSISCQQTLTATELLSMAEQSSPAEVKVTCFYTLEHKGEPHKSLHSNTSSISIQTPRPELTVNPQMITETDSVTVKCQTPSSVSVTQCFLYFMRKRKSTSAFCQQTLTGTELLSMAQQSSPAEVEVACFYMSQHKGGQYQSPHSNISFINIQTLPEPKLTVSRSEITETDSVTLKCEAPSSVPMSQCSFYSSTGATVKELPCLTTLTATELLKLANLKSPATVELNCFYATQRGAPNSPYSDFSSIIIQRANLKDKRTTDLTTFNPGTVSSVETVDTGTTSKDGRTTDLTTVRPGKTSSGHNDHTDVLILKLVVSTGCGVAVGVVLLGCVLVRNLKRIVPVNSVTSSSQAHCTDGLMNTTHLGQVSPPGNEQSYSIFTSVPAADPDSTQEDGQQLQNNESDIYHLYSTIPKEPATSALKSMVYSTVNPMYTSVNSV